MRQIGVPLNLCVVAPDILVPQYGTCFVTLLWCLQFRGGCRFFGKFVHPCFKVQKVICNKEFARFICETNVDGIGCGASTRNFNFLSLSVQYNNLYIPESVILTCFNSHVVMQSNGTESDVLI